MLPEMLKLYYAAGGCSISPHIALREANIPFELHRVDFLRGKRLDDGGDFARINPKGYIPALVLDNGELLTEGAAMVQYIADLRPESRLAPPPGTFERVRLQEWLNFIATELHKGLAPLTSKIANEEYKQATTEKFAGRLAYMSEKLAGKRFLMGDTFTVADGYAFYALRAWQSLKHEITGALLAYYERIKARPSVQAALGAEGFKKA
jgi:glutathione S-transferase